MATEIVPNAYLRSHLRTKRVYLRTLSAHYLRKLQTRFPRICAGIDARHPVYRRTKWPYRRTKKAICAPYTHSFVRRYRSPVRRPILLEVGWLLLPDSFYLRTPPKEPGYAGDFYARKRKMRKPKQDAMLAMLLREKPKGGEQFWVFSLVWDDARPTWEQRYSTMGTYEQCARAIVKMTHLMIANKMNLNGVRVESYQGANAKAYLADIQREEARYQDEGMNQSNN